MDYSSSDSENDKYDNWNDNSSDDENDVSSPLYTLLKTPALLELHTSGTGKTMAAISVAKEFNKLLEVRSVDETKRNHEESKQTQSKSIHNHLVMKKSPKYYDFDLELEPSKRWGPIIDDHQQFIPGLYENLRKLLDNFGMALQVIRPFYELTSKDSIYYYDEITYIAGRIGLSPYEILLMQLVYETSAACTSTVISYGPNDEKLFFRTMDWPMLFLKDLTIGLNVKRGDKLICKVVTWVGFIGFLTATSIDEKYTVSVNYRQTQEPNIWSILTNLNRLRQMIWPVAYLVRDLMERRVKRNIAFTQLQGTKIVSPCYLTFFNHNKPTSTSYVITRDWDQTVDLRNSDIIQTNCDWGKSSPNILYSLERRKLVAKIQKFATKNKDLKPEQIIEILQRFPIINEETIYLFCKYKDQEKLFV